MTKLKRSLSLTEVIFFGVGAVLGAGIYALIGKVAGFSGNLLWIAFLIASLTALLSAFSYAELTAAIPGAGGEFIYAKKALGNKMGIVLGSIVSMSGIISAATVSIGFSGYFSQLFQTPELIAAITILIIIFLVNASGIKQSSIVNVIFTVIELGGLLFVIYCALPSIGKINYLEVPSGGITDLLTAAALSFFAYLGFEKIVKLSEETVNPEKTIPKALFIAGGIVILIYTAVAISVISVMSPQELNTSKGPLADVAKSRFAETGVTIIAAIALFATSNTILSIMLGTSRVLLSMGREIKSLKMLSFVSLKRKTPVTSLFLVLILTCAFALIGNIKTVAFIANFFIFLTYLGMNVSVIVLRIKNKNLKRPFRIPGNINNIPVISVLGILMTLLLMWFTIIGLSKGASISDE
jgi:basic amino acid/polyamine antiporter, APA family